ncbi:hypothetical protein H311_00847 [Anncaliia algerae PRA109]|nr:hypothetical protein H311_00847 [Anncaliia algerae PRA109]
MVVPDKTAGTIRNILSLYVSPGSIVYTDCFKAYLPACRDLNLEHQTVNQSIESENNENGVRRNTIERLNNGVIHLIKPRNRSKKNINGWL